MWRRRDRVVDLREGAEALSSLPALAAIPAVDESALRAQMVRREAAMARAEAQRELEELRARHWSAERVLEEGRLGLEWWEHPAADPHAVLGLLPGDSLGDATRARRALAREVHPDTAARGEATRGPQMAAVNVAYDRLRRALAPVPDAGVVQDVSPPERSRAAGIELGRAGSA